jgi:hypothetical protein
MNVVYNTEPTVLFAVLLSLEVNYGSKYTTAVDSQLSIIIFP